MINVKIQQQQDAFTLLEVMIALLVFALSLTAITRSIHQAYFRHEYLTSEVLGQLVAQNQLEIFLASPSKRGLQGESEMHHIKFRYQIVLEPTADEQIQKVRVEVTRDNTEAIFTRESFMRMNTL